MTQWTLTIPDETDRAVRSILTESSGDVDSLSRFVNDAVQQRIFRMTVETIQNRNAAFDQQELMNIIDDAVNWARENPA